MSESEQKAPTEQKKTEGSKDSFEVPVEKSPLLWFTMLQIPLVILMIIMLYVLYQSQKA